MNIPNEINGGGGLVISENTVFDLEGRCSIQLSYGRIQGLVAWDSSAQSRAASPV